MSYFLLLTSPVGFYLRGFSHRARIHSNRAAMRIGAGDCTHRNTRTRGTLTFIRHIREALLGVRHTQVIPWRENCI